MNLWYVVWELPQGGHHGRDSRPSPHPAAPFGDAATVTHAGRVPDSPRRADSRGVAGPARITGDRGNGMTIFSRIIRRHLENHPPSTFRRRGPGAEPAGVAEATSTEPGQPPFAVKRPIHRREPR